MIPTIILWLLRKHIWPPGNKRIEGYPIITFFQAIYKKTVLSILFVLLMLTISAQEQTLDYNVTYKGENVGTMRLYQSKSGNNTIIKIVSVVQMRFIFNIKVHSEEESVFKNGKLVYSMIKRNVNGRENSYKQTKAAGDIYQTSTGGKKYTNKNLFIDYNLHLLYAFEPENIRKVYSDNFQQFVPIQKIAAHQYKIPLPDGNYNFYSFENGICSKVEIHNTLYSIQFKLK